MALNFTTTRKAAQTNGVKVLVYGKAGVGKTVLCATAPKPVIISAEAGLLSLQGADIPVIEVKNIEDLVEIATRSEWATLCLGTALSRQQLSDEIPAALDVAIPRGTRPPTTRARVRWHTFDPSTFEMGRERLPIQQSICVGQYGPERSVVDAFRLRGREGHELGYEALRRWLRRPGAQPAALLEMAGQFPRALTPLRQALEVLL